MQQYLELLKAIKERGTQKPAARAGMPGSLSLFGYQFRHNLQDGFPLLTTKKMFWKGIVEELRWFLKGDTNIKYLIDRGVNIWNEDAYNYYLKQCKIMEYDNPLSFDDFLYMVKTNFPSGIPNYRFGDCGFQYGRVWRDFGGYSVEGAEDLGELGWGGVDQIANVIKSLKENPQGRRHLVTAIDPVNDEELALYWCHALFQFNCRPIDHYDRLNLAEVDENTGNVAVSTAPKYYLDCQLYQRSADVFLGVPFNIASYALLTHIIATIVGMIPGEFIHTFGDVHIYDNHMEAVNEQLKRTPDKLPTLEITEDLKELYWNGLDFTDFKLVGYNPQPAIKAELSTGLIK